MTAGLVIALVVLAAAIGALAYLYGKATGGIDAAEASRRVTEEVAAAREAGHDVEREILDAAPPSLPPAARVDAVDRWVRENQDRLRARTGVPAGRRPPTNPARRGGR